MLEDIFAAFTKELEYLKGTSQETINLYRRSLKRYQAICGNKLPTKLLLSQFVVGMREKGYATTTCNITIRSFNSFLTWLHENEHTPRLRIKQLKEEKRTPPDVPAESLKKLIAYKPKGRAEKRIWALGLLLIDTGCRIKELLTLKRENVDLDNCIISVVGKGNKQRIVPFSLEARGILFRHLKTHNHDYVFCARNGQRISYTNSRRDFSLLCDRIKIPHISFHKLRHNYALNFVRNGGVN